MTLKIAKLLSIVLGPQIWLPVLLLIFTFKTGLSSQQTKILLPSMFILQVFVPLSYLYLAPKLGWATEWDLPLRKERHSFFVVLSISYFLSFLLIYFYGNKLLFNLELTQLVLLIIFVVITRFWQISLHGAVNTAGAILINFLFNWNLPILFLTILVISWARLKLKRHNISQLLASIALTTVVILGSLKYFGYI